MRQAVSLLPYRAGYNALTLWLKRRDHLFPIRHYVRGRYCGQVRMLTLSDLKRIRGLMVKDVDRTKPRTVAA